MPQKTKTIYVKDGDLSLWKTAEKLSGKSISGLIEDLLRRYVTEQTFLKNEPVQKFLVAPNKNEKGGKIFDVTIKKFMGQLVVDGAKEEGWSEYIYVALTQKGKYVIWEQDQKGQDPSGIWEAQRFQVYGSLEEAYKRVWDPHGGIINCSDETIRAEVLDPVWPEQLFTLARAELRRMGSRPIEEMDIEEMDDEDMYRDDMAD